MIKRWLAYSLALVLALALGLGSAFGALGWLASLTTIKNGPWQTDVALGSPDASIYTRAYIAIHGLFALQAAETIYFTAFTDDSGMRLTDTCAYRIEGRSLAARWWSITLYGEDDFLVPNAMNRYSYSATTVQWSPDQTYTIQLSQPPKQGNWLPLTGSGDFSLSIRLYNPDPAVYTQPELTPLPHIIREQCG